jgi:hypothetical protein
MTEFHKGQEVEVWAALNQWRKDSPKQWRKARIVEGPLIDHDLGYKVELLDGSCFVSRHIRECRYSYDSKCGEVAAWFLKDAPDWLVKELAQHIQDEIEGWLSFNEERIGAAVLVKQKGDT